MTLKVIYPLLLIFAAAIFLRFLYFPSDIYFGYDQARDAFAAKEILNGHPKIIGPTTTFEGLRHGVFHYYLYAPFYLIGAGNPEIVAGFLRVLNASGVVIIFAISAILFNRYVGFISAWLFAVSFEQTQIAMYFSNPSFDVISVLLLYLGLSLLVFKKKDYGLIIAIVGLGLSIQFQFFFTYLFIPFILILVFFRKSIPHISFKTMLLTIAVFLLTISTFIAAELKFSFRSVKSLLQLVFQGGSQKSFYRIISTYIFEMGQVIKFSLTGTSESRLIVGLASFVSFLLLLKTKVNKQIIFLGIWFFSTLIVYYVTGGDTLSVDVIQYHPNIGASSALMIFISYILYIIGKKTHLFVTFSILLLLTLGNLSLIQKYNPLGSMPELQAQSHMILSNEKKVLDFIYQDAKGEQFAVKAVTLPFYINTTWSYLFEWYGKDKYKYLPVWGGKNADGYPGNLQVIDAQDKLPSKSYLIIEPARGIPVYLTSQYLIEEGYFTDLIKEEQIGSFKVQVRVKK